MASAVVSDNFETGTGGVPQLGGTGATTCKAWVNFNGTGTVAIRDSYNVSSITDIGPGVYYVNLSTAMANANYSINFNCTDDASTNRGMNIQGLHTTYTTTSTFRLTIFPAADSNGVYAQVFGD